MTVRELIDELEKTVHCDNVCYTVLVEDSDGACLNVGNFFVALGNYAEKIKPVTGKDSCVLVHVDDESDVTVLEFLNFLKYTNKDLRVYLEDLPAYPDGPSVSVIEIKGVNVYDDTRNVALVL